MRLLSPNCGILQTGKNLDGQITCVPKKTAPLPSCTLEKLLGKCKSRTAPFATAFVFSQKRRTRLWLKLFIATMATCSFMLLCVSYSQRGKLERSNYQILAVKSTQFARKRRFTECQKHFFQELFDAFPKYSPNQSHQCCCNLVSWSLELQLAMWTNIC